MSQPNSTTTSAIKGAGFSLGRLFRFIVFIFTSGYAYPHVCTEGMDLTKLHKQYEDDANKKN